MNTSDVANGAPTAEKLGWRLGMQAWTFNRFTFFDAIDKTASLGLRVIESYPGQNLSAGHADARMHHDMDPSLYAAVRDKLASAGMELACYGVVALSGDEAESRKVFDFARAMEIETIVSEPDPDAFDLLDRLTEEYKIGVAIHNHPEPSQYWNPDTVLAACEGRGPRIGACADTGHWMRSGIDPLEAIRTLEGRIVTLHFKDLNKFAAGGDCHDVPFGQGAGDVRAWLAELRRQRVEAVFAIEHEHNWENSVPEIAEGVVFFERAAQELAG